jgi:hypothetical protein
MKTFEQWLEDEGLRHPTGEIELDGARVGFDMDHDVATIVAFEGLDWMKPGVIEKAVELVRQASGARKVKTSEGIRQHWAHVGYEDE